MRSLSSTTALLCFTLALMSRGAFITFEGSEGCGKSTQAKRLATRLEETGVPVLLTREPGGTAIGEKIRDLLQFAPEGFAMAPETELLLFQASRSQLVREIIRPALEQGSVVISDRFFDSTTVYQGVARKLEPGIVAKLNDFAVGPTARTDFCARGEYRNGARAACCGACAQSGRSIGWSRSRSEFYERVCEGYRELARREPARIRLLDGAHSPDEIENEIWREVSERFPALVCVFRKRGCEARAS